MPPLKYNLHNHTYYSDGELSPTEVVQFNKKKGYDVIAITDHDSIEGIREAMEAGKRLGVTVIPGIEITAAKTHMLGFFIDYTNPKLLNFLEQRKRRTEEITAHILKGLEQMGYRLTPELIHTVTNARQLNSWRISFALSRLGMVKNEKAARALVGKVPWKKTESVGTRSSNTVTEKEAIMLVRAAQGCPVLAHPLLGNKKRSKYFTFPLRAFTLKRAGLGGLEVQHSDHSRFERGFLHGVATIFALNKTGGADFHGPAEMEKWIKIPQSKGVSKSIRALSSAKTRRK